MAASGGKAMVFFACGGVGVGSFGTVTLSLAVASLSGTCWSLRMP